MNTNNIISTPNITGNIGSCESSTESLQISGDFWGYTKKDYLTNSCTGQVTEGTPYWNVGFGVFALPVILLLILAVVVDAITRNVILN